MVRRTDRVSPHWQLALLLFLTGSLCQAADWPQFLGPDRSGQSAETQLLNQFSVAGPPVLWRTPLGIGMSGVAVSGDTVVTLAQDSEQQFAVALEARTGTERWRTAVAESYQNSMGNGPRATPTIHDGRVLVFTGEGLLAALQLDSGKLLWSVDTVAAAGGKPAEYGMVSSPLVVGQTVVVHTGTPEAAVSGYSLNDGSRVWTAGSGTAGYSSPVLITHAGQPQILSFLGSQLLSIDPDSGRVLWQYPYVTDYDCNIATPVQLSQQSLLISAGENHGSTVLQLPPADAGSALKTVWESLGQDSVLRAEWQTPVLIDGYLYGLDNVGSAGPITNLVCVRAADGRQMWRQTRFGKGNLIAADGRLWISTMKGELVLVDARPDGFHELGRTAVLKMTRQAPALADGRLYLRDDHELVCLDVRAAAK